MVERGEPICAELQAFRGTPVSNHVCTSRLQIETIQHGKSKLSSYQYAPIVQEPKPTPYFRSVSIAYFDSFVET